MVHQVKAVLADDAGQALAEYGLLVGLIAVVCVGAITLLGNHILAAFTTIANDIHG